MKHMSKTQYQRNADGDFICPHCPKVISKENPSTMHYHLRKHEGNYAYSCKHCEFKSFFQHKLDHHMVAKHSNEAQVPKIPVLKCPFPNCTFQSLTKGNCVIHFMRKHCKQEVDVLLDQNGICRHCGAEFQSNTAFQYHASTCASIQDAPKHTMLRTILAY